MNTFYHAETKVDGERRRTSPAKMADAFVIHHAMKCSSAGDAPEGRCSLAIATALTD
jgi:hypothetical protein